MHDMAAEITELLAIHQGLNTHEEPNSEIVISGNLAFEAVPEDLPRIADTFEIEVRVPTAYSAILPEIRETGGKIHSEYEHVFPNGTLCLGVPIELRRIFSRQPSLLGFMNGLVIPYFYGYCYWNEHGEHPFGEQKHGGEGIIEYYTNRLNLREEVQAVAFICFLYEYGYRGHHNCPCGSGQRVRHCHGPILLDLHKHHTPHTLTHDLSCALDHLFEKFKDNELSLPDPLLKQIGRIAKGKNRRRARRRRF